MTMSKKNMLILAGLAIGGVGVASMLAEGAGDGGENIQEKIRQRAGNILGGETTTTTTTTGTKKDAQIAAQPDVFFAAFPTDEDVFGVVESQDKPAARRGGGGGMTSAQRTAYDIMTATAMGGGGYTPPAKKAPYDPSLLAIAPAGVAAKGAVQAAAVTEAQRVSRAGVVGGGAITSFLKDVGGYAVSTPGRIGSAGAASSRAISSAARGVTGISKKSTPQPKKSTYIRRSKKGYTYSKTGSLTPK